jgi:hypothetical protein
MLTCGAASAAIVAGGAPTYIASTSAPPASQTFGLTTTTVTVDAATGGAAWGVGQLFTAGNILTFTLNSGALFQTLPTVSMSTCGTTTAVFSSGGVGFGQVSYQITGATPLSTCALVLTGIQVNTVSSAADQAAVTVTLTDQAGALNSTTVTARRQSVATFASPYTFSFSTTGAANTNILLGTSNPGARYGSTGTNAGTPTLGTVTVTSADVRAWGSTPLTIGTGTPSLVVNLPSGPFVSASLGVCTATPSSTTSQSAPGVVTFPNVTIGAPTSVATVSCTVSLGNPTSSATALLGSGATSASVSIPVVGAPVASYSGSGALSSILFDGGTSIDAGYVTGNSAVYDSFISVTTGATAGPIIVTARTAGGTGTAVLATSQAANTNVLYTMDAIRTALTGAGMPSGTFATDTDRGSLTIVVPGGPGVARVAPLLRNRANGTVVEMSRQGSGGS